MRTNGISSVAVQRTRTPYPRALWMDRHCFRDGLRTRATALSVGRNPSTQWKIRRMRKICWRMTYRRKQGKRVCGNLIVSTAWGEIKMDIQGLHVHFDFIHRRILGDRSVPTMMSAWPLLIQVAHQMQIATKLQIS